MYAFIRSYIKIILLLWYDYRWLYDKVLHIIKSWAQKKYLTVPFLSICVFISFSFLNLNYTPFPKFLPQKLYCSYLLSINASYCSKMCVYVLVNASLKVHVCMYCTRMHACISELKCACICVHLCVCACVYVSPYGHECVGAWPYERVFEYVYVYQWKIYIIIFSMLIFLNTHVHNVSVYGCISRTISRKIYCSKKFPVIAPKVILFSLPR